MHSTELPLTVDGVDLAWVRDALRMENPDVDVSAMSVREVQYSTGTRVLVEVVYAGNGSTPPQELCIKGGFDCPDYGKRAITFRQEALTYGEVLPHVSTYRPACYFAGVDESSGQGVVILEDLVAAGGTANRALEAPTVDGAADYLDTLAMLHASSWDAPFLDHFGWLNVSLSATDLFRRWWDAAELERYLVEEHRAELVDPVLQDPARLLAMVEQLAPVAARRPRSVLHGDTHIGNTYRDASGRAGFLDWQGITQGPWVRDVTYFLVSNLEVEDRRAHERDLLEQYLERLSAYGVEPPGLDEAWTEYRRWVIVPLLVWIRNADRHQPRDANRLGALRASTAMMDLEVLDLYN